MHDAQAACGRTSDDTEFIVAFPTMKWLFRSSCSRCVVFGGAAFFSYDFSSSRRREIIAEKSGEIPVEPVPDIGLPGISGAAKLRQERTS